MSLLNNKYINMAKKTIDSFRPKQSSSKVQKSSYEGMQERADNHRKRLARSKNVENLRKDARRRWNNDR